MIRCCRIKYFRKNFQKTLWKRTIKVEDSKSIKLKLGFAKTYYSSLNLTRRKLNTQSSNRDGTKRLPDSIS